MTTNPHTDRYERLLVWMGDHDISFPATGEQLGLSDGGARSVLFRDTCRTVHHNKLIELGFPVELLPEPRDKPRGRPRKIPKFPGLSQQIAQA